MDNSACSETRSPGSDSSLQPPRRALFQLCEQLRRQQRQVRFLEDRVRNLVREGRNQAAILDAAREEIAALQGHSVQQAEAIALLSQLALTRPQIQPVTKARARAKAQAATTAGATATGGPGGSSGSGKRPRRTLPRPVAKAQTQAASPAAAVASVASQEICSPVAKASLKRNVGEMTTCSESLQQ